MRDFPPVAYGPVLAPLVGGDRCRALDSGRPDAGVRKALSLATVDAAFVQTPLADRDMAACAIAGLWLLHDFLDESHAISQHVETPTGAFWHGIMHRREGDFSNAKYWFRRVGAHEALDALAERVAEQHLALGNGPFDAFTFVDACQAALRNGGQAIEACRRVQQLEWELLFDFCYRQAVAA